MSVKQITVHHDLDSDVGKLINALSRHIGDTARSLCMLDVAYSVVRWALDLAVDASAAARALTPYVPVDLADALIDSFYRGVKRRLMPPVEFQKAKNQGQVRCCIDEDYSLSVTYTFYMTNIEECVLVKKGFRLFTEDLEESISLARFARLDREKRFLVIDFIAVLMNVMLNNPDVTNPQTLLEFAKLSVEAEVIDENFVVLFTHSVSEFREQAMRFHRDAIRQICRDEILDEQAMRELVVDFTVTDVDCFEQHREYFVEIDCEYRR